MRTPRRARSLVATTCALLLAVPLVARSQDGDGDDDAEPTTPLARVVTVFDGADGGRPRADVTVEAWGLAGGVVTRRTGADGSVRFDGMPRRGVTFVARAPGRVCGHHAPGGFSWAPPPEDDDPDGDGVTQVNLRLRAGSTLTGRVLANDDGAPLAGAHVEAWEQALATDQFELDAAPLWTAETDAVGTWHTDQHTPRDEVRASVGLRLVVRAADHVHAELDIDDLAQLGDEVEPQRLLPAGTLAGRVTRADGSAVAHARVRALPPNDRDVCGRDASASAPADDPPTPELLAHADADGRFAFDEAQLGVAYVLVAEEPGAPRDEFDDEPLAIARSPLARDVTVAQRGERVARDLVVRRLGRIEIRVAGAGERRVRRLNIAGEAPAGAWRGADLEREAGKLFIADADAGRWTFRVWTAERGEFTFTLDVAEGAVTTHELDLNSR